MWNQELIKKVIQTKKFAVIAATVVSTATGSVAGYFVAKKRLESKYAALSEKEIQEAKIFYSQRYKTGEFADLSALAEKYDDEEVEPMSEEDKELMGTLKEALLEKGYVSSEAVTEDAQTSAERIEVKASIEKNVFSEREPTSDDGGFDLDVELEKKSQGKPYILEAEEFFENETENSQTTLIYYEGDSVLADERDQPIDNIKGVVGEDNLHFGRGSLDENIVYIRNPRFNADYEVTRSTGKFAEEVMGFIQHSDRRHSRSPRKFRDFD